MPPLKIFLCSVPLLASACSMTSHSHLDRLFESYRHENVPGAAVLVIRNGEPLFSQAYGLADLERNSAAELATNFRLASVTKQFTAMCIMMLAERGALRYDNSLCDLFPNFPQYGGQIKLRHLLQHTSGLIDYEDLIPDTATVQVLDRDVLRMMMAQDSTYFPPGSQFRYSNGGYAILAMVVEKVSRMPFARFLQENVFTPLGMTNTVAYENGISSVNHRAMGYRAENGGFVFSDQSLTSAVLGDGGIYSSVLDLLKWDQALYSEQLVRSASLQEAFTSGTLSNGEQTGYGFGWWVDTYRGQRRQYHTGSTCGFRNVIQRFPEARFTVIILTNRAEPDVAPLADKLTDKFLLGIDP